MNVDISGLLEAFPHTRIAFLVAAGLQVIVLET